MLFGITFTCQIMVIIDSLFDFIVPLFLHIQRWLMTVHMRVIFFFVLVLSCFSNILVIVYRLYDYTVIESYLTGYINIRYCNSCDNLSDYYMMYLIHLIKLIFHSKGTVYIMSVIVIFEISHYWVDCWVCYCCYLTINTVVLEKFIKI